MNAALVRNSFMNVCLTNNKCHFNLDFTKLVYHEMKLQTQGFLVTVLFTLVWRLLV